MIETLIRNDAAQRIISVLAAQGYETRFVGGSVRDALLKKPIHEIDLATTATPEQIITAFGKERIKTIPTGIDHGTVTVVIDDQPFEITTLRHDIETNGRHAIVSFTDNWEEDAKRRDFTINAMSIDAAGTLFDYCDGQADLEQKHLRFIGNAAQRIKEDYLRILRFFRFASVLDWAIDDTVTLKICADLADNLELLSRERIQSELFKLLLGPGCLRIVEIMQQQNIFAFLNEKINFERFRQTVLAEEKYQQPDGFRRLLALAGWQQTELEKVTVLSRTNKQRLENLDRINNQKDQKLQKLLYFYGQQAVIDYFFLLHMNWNYQQIAEWQKPIFPIKAEDVFHLSNGPGIEVGRLMKKAELYWVEHDFNPSKRELLDILN